MSTAYFVSVGISVALSFAYFEYLSLNNTLITQLTPAINPTCRQVKSAMPIPGPEDMALSKMHNILFVTSDDRRNFERTGSLFRMFVDICDDSLVRLDSNYPEHFHPHGMSIFENRTVVQLYVISHPLSKIHAHSIEIFSYDLATQSLVHFETLYDNSLLTSPNDLIVIGLNLLLVSNDHKDGSMVEKVMDDISKTRSSTLVYFNGAKWSKVETSPLSAFGNGLILVTEQSEEFLYRSSTTDYSLLKYRLTRTLHSDEISLSFVLEEKLAMAPDNLELDATTGGILIAGHPSTAMFMLHAIFHIPIPSSVVTYFGANRSIVPLYVDPVGTEISASSTAIRHDNKLYVGQVFDPFVLMCDIQQ